MNKLWYFILIMLTACASNVPMNLPDVKSAPSPAPVKSSPVVIVESYPVTGSSNTSGDVYEEPTDIVMVSSYLYPTDKNIDVPFNLVLLPKKPITDLQKKQYKFICESWKSTFPNVNEVKKYLDKNDDTHLLPIYWLLKKKTVNDNCDTLIENYDYARAQVLYSKIGIDSYKVLLVSKNNLGVFTMDLSPLIREKDITLSIDTWKKNMCKSSNSDKEIRGYYLVSTTRRVLGILGTLVSMKLNPATKLE